MQDATHNGSHGRPKMKSPYTQLALMGLLHLPIMYAVMFTMVYSMNEVVHNLNTFYMAGMMAAPMVVMMPLLMREMYPDKKFNILVYASAVGLFLVLFWFMREQTFVGDRQFLRSMIPHHSGAILMCEKSELQDAELKSLCARIVRDQRSEIELMEKMLERI